MLRSVSIGDALRLVGRVDPVIRDPGFARELANGIIHGDGSRKATVVKGASFRSLNACAPPAVSKISRRPAARAAQGSRTEICRERQHRTIASRHRASTAEGPIASAPIALAPSRRGTMCSRRNASSRR